MPESGGGWVDEWARRGILLLALAVALLSSTSCFGKGDGETIDLGTLPAQTNPSAATESPSEGLVFAVAAVNSPRSTLDAYQELALYLGERLGIGAKLLSSKTYAEINSLVRSGDATLAMVCSGAYVFGHSEFGMELLASPVISGEQTYRSYLIVPAQSNVSGWEDLRGKTFAFTDPLSNSGRLVPLYEISRMGKIPESFFSKYIFTYSHDNSIKAVAHGLVDAAAVDSLIYEYALTTGQDDAARTKVIWRSTPYPINPVVVNPRLDPTKKAELRRLLLEMHLDPEGKLILKRLGFDRFAPTDDGDYDSIRDMVRATGAGTLP